MQASSRKIMQGQPAHIYSARSSLDRSQMKPSKSREGDEQAKRLLVFTGRSRLRWRIDFSCLLSPCPAQQLRSALDKVDELESNNSHLSKRLEKIKSSRGMAQTPWSPPTFARPLYHQAVSSVCSRAAFNSYVVPVENTKKCAISLRILPANAE